MERNKNIDILRAAAILIIVFYHCYVLSGNPYSSLSHISTLFSFGGEIGVTLFFLLSGFGIYSSLSHKESSSSFPSWISFMKNRCRRILPQYYACLLILLLCTPASAYVNGMHLFNLIVHFFLVHNLFVSTSGAINGVLWTLGVTFQFYLFAILFFRLLRKNRYLFLGVSIAFTIFSKYIMYHYFIPNIPPNDFNYFIFGRQLYTSLDNFIIGMFVADALNRPAVKKRPGIFYILLFASTVLAIYLCPFWITTASRQLYEDSVYAYIWHSVLAILLGLLTYAFSHLHFRTDRIIFKIFLLIAKYQYGIYLWHLVIINSLITYSTFFNRISREHFEIFSLLIIMLSIMMGFLSTLWFDGRDYRSLLPIKKDLN